MQDSIYTKFVTVEDFKLESQSRILDFKCVLCQGIYLNPVIDQCEHIFCEACFKIAYAKSHACPITNNPIKSSPIKVNLISSILERQSLYCRNKTKGCEWSGFYRDLSSHLSNECMKETVRCLYDNCQSKFLREEYSDHIDNCSYRTIKCPDCQMEFLSNQNKDHELKCLKRKIQCTQGCNLLIERDNISNHIKNDCLFTLTDCPYAKYGCEDRFFKKDKDKTISETTEKHLLLLTKSYEELEKKTNELEKQLAISKRNNINDNSNKELSIVKCNNALQSNDFNRNFNYDQETLLIGKKRHPFDEIEVISLTNNSNSNSIITKNEIIKKEELLSKEKDDEEEDENDDVIMIDDCDESKQDSLFDRVHISPYFKINNNRVKYDISTRTKHNYLLGSKGIELQNKNCITSWNITLLTQTHWIAFGICDKDRVLYNNLEFPSNQKDFDHGSFLISSNGLTLNSNFSEENNKVIDMPDINKGDKLAFQYNPMTQSLTLSFKESTYYLTHVYPNRGNKLVICILFFHPHDEIEIDNYKTTFHITSS